MPGNYHIRYLQRQEIDIARWDLCVTNAPNGWIYARSFFLDGLGKWSALVEGDYDYIMPLPEKKKYGIRYIYDPPFAGQLGIIGTGPVSRELTDLFIRSVPASFYLVDILLNEQNPGPSVPGVRIITRSNYILPLEDAYTTLNDHYTADAKKNLRRTRSLGLAPTPNIPVDKIVALYRAAYEKKTTRIREEDYNRLSAIANRCLEEGNGFTLGIRDPAGELLAAAFFGLDDKRIYYILGAPTPQGRRSNAIHCLIDEVIKKYAGTGLVFDFEGSDIPSVASFYRKFNPLLRPYDFVQLNRLPRWVSWLRNKTSGIIHPGTPIP
jgi:hypothetical protein